MFSNLTYLIKSLKSGKGGEEIDGRGDYRLWSYYFAAQKGKSPKNCEDLFGIGFPSLPFVIQIDNDTCHHSRKVTFCQPI